MSHNSRETGSIDTIKNLISCNSSPSKAANGNTPSSREREREIEEKEENGNSDKTELTECQKVYLKCHTNAFSLVIECRTATIT